MKCSKIFLFYLASIAISIAEAQTGITHKIIIESPRALNDALGQLQKDLDCIVTFEDAPYETSIRTEELFTGSFPTPQTHSFIFEYNPIDEFNTIISNLLESYNAIDNTATFEISTDPLFEDVFHVVPKSYIAQNNHSINIGSIFEKEISIEMEKESSWVEIINSICSEVSQVSTRVFPSGFSTGTSLSDPITFANASAQSCLTTVIKKLSDKKLSWAVRRGPPFRGGEDFAVLNILCFPPKDNTCQDVFLNFESIRPLFSSSSKLARLLNRTIIYEDIEYVCPCSLMRGPQGTPQIPRGGIIEFSFDSRTNDLSIFETSIQAYNTMNDAGDFEVQAIGETFYLFPIVAMDTNSIPQFQQTLLTQKISLPAMNTTVGEFINYMAEAISLTTKKRISCSNIQHELSEISISTPLFENKEVSHMLVDITRMIESELIWELLYHPHSKSYSLGVKKIQPEH